MKITNEMDVYVKDLDFLNKQYQDATTDDRKEELIFMISRVTNELTSLVRSRLDYGNKKTVSKILD